MSLQSFFDNFALLADAPNGVLKLRELILRLAVLGKLVSQNPREQHDDEFLKRNRLESRAKEQNTDRLPLGWVRCQLSSVLDVQNGFAFKSEMFTESSEGIPLIRIRDLKTSRTTVRYTGSYKEEYTVHRGDYLIGMDGDFNIHLWQGTDALLNQRVCRLHDYSPYVDPSFISYVIQEKLDEIHRGTSFVTVKHLSSKSIKAITIDLPPLQEQARIVAKVDELMRLCDESELRQQARRESLVRLNSATLAPLNRAASLARQEHDDSTMRLDDNFDALYDSGQTVGKLRSTILQLAVQGRLVPQDTQDETASELVTRIKRLRGDLSDTKIAKVEQMSSIEADDMSFPLPDGWRWTRLAEICELITKGSSPKWQGISYVNEGEGILFVTSENVGSHRMLFDNRKFVEARFNDIEPRSILRRNDLLMNIVGASIGRAAAFDSDEVANINQAVCLIRVAEPALVPYLLQFLNSDLCIQMMFDQQVDNARANLSMGNIAKFPIPVPPLAEQKRIVAKVNQLMALCDELEAKLRQAEADSEKLMNAAVQHVLAAVSQKPTEGFAKATV